MINIDELSVIKFVFKSRGTTVVQVYMPRKCEEWMIRVFLLIDFGIWEPHFMITQQGRRVFQNYVIKLLLLMLDFTTWLW